MATTSKGNPFRRWICFRIRDQDRIKSWNQHCPRIRSFTIEIIKSLSMHLVTTNNFITSPAPPYKAHHYGVG
ncbi:hypothetical protein Lal_00002366 [Lupinus albus]|nr:hypothetical protein Lal_00002366 [Lupinus albus]